MAWKEYGKDEPPPVEKEYNILAIIFGSFMVALMMYMLGKSDGREDAMKDQVKNCATVEIIKDG